jgi:hypothetical protein
MIESECGFSALTVADANGIFDGRDEDFAVADLTGSSSGDKRLDYLFHSRVWNHYFNLHFRKEIYFVLGAPVDLRMTFLASMAPNLDEGHSVYAGADQGLLYLI